MVDEGPGPTGQLLSELTEGQRVEAMRRFELLCRHLHGTRSIAQIAADAEVVPRTIQRWLATYRERGLAGLAPKPRNDAGSRRVHGQLVTVIESLYLRRPAPSVATVHRAACEIATAQGWAHPSYGTVRGIIGCLDIPLLTLAHEGGPGPVPQSGRVRQCRG
jgi:putative transposase